MATFTQICYHIVFSTKNRERGLPANKRDDLFRYTWGILKNKDCHLYRIGGVADHIHILTEVHPAIALADLVKDIKTSTSSWIKAENTFPDFTHRQDGYGAFTVAPSDKDAVIEYSKGQEEHHKTVSFKDELREFQVRHGVTFDEKHPV
jgi:putative transposase